MSAHPGGLEQRCGPKRIGRHKAGLKEMVSTCGAEEMAQWLARVDPPRSERAAPVLPGVSAIAWPLRVGGPWRVLPGGFPA